MRMNDVHLHYVLVTKLDKFFSNVNFFCNKQSFINASHTYLPSFKRNK